MLYTPQAPVLDLRGQNITSTLDSTDTFYQLCLCPTEDNHQGESSPNCRRKSQKTKGPNKQLSESDTSDEEPINPILKTSVEERHYGTMPGSVLATQAVLSHSRAPVERGPSCKVRVKKLPKEKATDKSTQTEKQKQKIK